MNGRPTATPSMNWGDSEVKEVNFTPILLDGDQTTFLS